jgi:UDP-N-acetylmuramoylalanine--D-glutamate ligase
MDLTGKRVAVYGLGVSGLSALAYLQDIKLAGLLVVDGRQEEHWSDEAKAILSSFENDQTIDLNKRQQEEGDVSDLFSKQDLIILSPGIARESDVLKKAIKNQVEVLNEIEVGYRILQSWQKETPPNVLAITGTNGKTTCVTFLGEVLKEANIKTFVGGNIGTPLLRSLKGQKSSPFDLYLFEVSSFQCESLAHFRPQVAGILNLAANHGERYASVEDYRQAKWLLAKGQDKEDAFLVGPGVGEPAISIHSKIHHVTDQAEAALKENFDLSQLKLVGAHNRWNLGFCWLFLKEAITLFGWDPGLIRQAFQDTLSSFPGVEHRLEYVGKILNQEVYNDAKSTNWLATLTALEAVKERQLPITLILGGQLRGHNDEPPSEIQELLKKVRVLSIGESGASLKRHGHTFDYCGSLEEVMKVLKAEGKKDALILFSPAFPSFDQFQNYADRGRTFKKMVKQLY